ncbi:flavin reductase family protein [Mesorhizobium sp. CAU 1741]|uniref:flavin reductase family protein n=1 Tax=Mesorhizobium sp. CAU 1741 TaxID=3140366 RepID=UPI00325BE58B
MNRSDNDEDQTMTIHVEAVATPDMAIDDGAFRSIMRTMVNGVTVITTSHDGHVHGMTATAFSSVSAEPPTVLIVLNRSTRTHPLVSASRHFVVNLLSQDQAEVGARFAGKLDNQFDGVPHRLNEEGIPLIDDVVATLECETINELAVGTHTIFIGRVIRGSRSHTMPLVYHDGNFKAVASS